MVKVSLSLMKNVLTPVGKIVLVLLKLTAPASVTDTSTNRKKSQLGDNNIDKFKSKYGRFHKLVKPINLVY